MSTESQNAIRDPRTRLVREKYFSLHPKPLERWLWQQGLPQAAERVFWLHWEEGLRAGDWCSQIPLKRVAAECCVDPSTVTRAYQLLKRQGLIRRQDPGRDEQNPFQQATAITEVLLPRELLTELHRAPNRRSPQAAPDAGPDREREAGHPQSPAPAPTVAASPAVEAPRLDRRAMDGLFARLSPAERRRHYEASRDYRTHIEFDNDTRLSPDERGALLALLASHAASRPMPGPISAPRPRATAAPTRALTQIEVARLRRGLLETLPNAAARETLREVVWAVEEGTLSRFAPAHAVNIALKLVRDGAWTRPNRMPPNWQRALARPETCTAA
jgi:DNA-binding MarR family transcriptional regulator